jgi:hypothetical protein
MKPVNASGDERPALAQPDDEIEQRRRRNEPPAAQSTPADDASLPQ